MLRVSGSDAAVACCARPVLPPVRIDFLAVGPAVRISAGQDDQAHALEDLADLVGFDPRTAIRQADASRLRLEQVRAEVEQRVGRNPFAGMDSADIDCRPPPHSTSFAEVQR